MNDINNVTIVGRLTKDCEVRACKNGSQIIKLSVANNYSYKQGNEWIEEANFFNVTLFTKEGNRQANVLTRGVRVCVSGVLRQDKWEKDGKTYSSVGIIANQVQVLAFPKGAEPDTPEVPRAPRTAAPAVPAGPEGYDDDSIPF